MTKIVWPQGREELLRLATALHELIGGRQDVAARYYDFTGNEGERVKGWAPFKGRRVAKDYKPMPGELVASYVDRKTAQTEFRVLVPMTPTTLLDHLNGRERLGVYVLDAEAQCKFLAADFDDHKGQLDPAAVWAEVRRFVETCEAHEWRVHVERSKSGAGYHVWLFFDAPVPAGELRAIGRWLFEESQTLREGEDFSTFDRFFPAQAKLPPAGKGYGNLIGLPMCSVKEYAAGRTAWVDAQGELIPDPRAYTLAILEAGRNPAARVPAFMAEWELKPDEAGDYEGPARDPNVQLGTAAEFLAVRACCRFMDYVSNQANWDSVTEPLWFSWVSNACRFEGGDTWIHDSSLGHPHYNALSTDIKIQHARSSAGPHKCGTIQRNGFKHCPTGGCKLPSGNPTSAPAGLAAWGRSEAPPAKRDRSVKVQLTPTPPAQAAATDSPPEAAGGESENPAPWAQQAVAAHPDTNLPWPEIHGGWNVDADGITDHQNQFICMRPLWVDALTRNNMELFGLSIRFFDLDWRYRKYAFPRDRLHEQGGVLGRELALLGLPIVPGKEKWVSRFLVIQEKFCHKRIRAATRLGWFDAPESSAVFVLPTQVLGKAAEEIVYQPDQVGHTADTIHGRGQLKDWQKGVADPCKGNPVLMFSLMLGMAGPLLKPCQEQSGGFHLYGVTTGGKTTAAQVAASIWGCGADPQEGPEVTSIRKWYATGNALESIAEVHNDSLLTLDEISEVDPMELGRIIYQLAGGLSKGRANAGGGLRAMRTWRLLWFSTGEKSVRQMLAHVGQDQKGGQRVRLPDIPADNSEDGGRAIVMDAKGKDPKDFVQDLKAACAKHYGLAGPVFVAYLIAEAEKTSWSVLAGTLRDELKHLEVILSKDDVGQALDIPPEGRRVIRRFALVALAGARASLAGIISWTLADIILAIKHVRDRWLSEQGREKSEMDRGLAHLRDELLAHSDRFRRIDQAPRAPIRDLLGFRADDYYLVTEAGLRELCGEFDLRTILRSLKSKGYLWSDKGRLTRKSPKIEGYGNTRPNLYWINVNFLGDVVEEETEEDQRAHGKAPKEGAAPGDWDDDIPF